MVRRVAYMRRTYPIRVPSKVLSGASVKTWVLRVRRSVFASVALLANKLAAKGGATMNKKMMITWNRCFCCQTMVLH